MKKAIAILAGVLFLCITALASESGNEADFLKMLSVIDDFDAEAPVSRGVYVDMLTKALNLSAEGAASGVFEDVIIASPYAAAISKASELGFVTGDGNGLFYPDEAVSFEAAIKMAVSALGYDAVASARGGYPTGYIAVAKDIDLTDGVELMSEMNYANAVQLIYNFLHTDMCSDIAVCGSEITSAREHGVTPLSKNFNLTKVEGVIKESGYVSMIPGAELDKSRITVGGFSFSFDEASSRYLGMNSEVWVDMDKKEVKAISLSLHNSVTVVNSEDIESKSGKLIRVFDDGYKTKAYTLDNAVTFVKNGRCILPSDTDYIPPKGTLTLIDNNSDKTIDVVISEVPEYMVVSYTDIVNGIVYDNSVGGASVVFNRENGFYYHLTMIDKKGNATEGYAEEISEGTVLTVYRSDDGKYVKAISSAMRVKAVLEEIGSDFVVAGGTKYKINSVSDRLPALIPGREYTFLLADDGSITAISQSGASSIKYGFFLDFCSAQNGIAKEAQISVLTAGGKVIYPYLSDKVIFNGASVSKTDAALSAAFLKEGYPIYQVIRYELDADGFVTMVDTAESVSEDESPEIKYADTAYGNNTLKKHLKTKRAFWYKNYGIFAPFVSLGGETVMFSIPKELADGVPRRIDEKYFSVITKSSLSAYHTYTIDAYDVNKNMQPAIIVFYNPNSGENIEVSDDTASGIVESVSRGFNIDGVTTDIITYWSNGTCYKRPLSNDAAESLKTAGITVQSGDIIRAAVDEYGEIKALNLDVEYIKEKDSLDITDSAPKSGQYDDAYYRGKSFAHSKDTLTLCIDEASGFDSAYSDPIIGNIAAFTIIPGCTAIIYDTKTATVKSATVDSVADVMAVGEENASRLVLKTYSHGIEQIFIYE